MTDLAWLTGHRFECLVKHEFTWSFHFTGAVKLQAECLWRLLESGRIRLTSKDHGHWFGLPAPVDGVLEVNQRIAGAAVVSVRLDEATLDLSLVFSSGHVLEFFPDSAGYEAWQLCGGSLLAVAVGGGDLAVFGASPRNDGSPIP